MWQRCSVHVACCISTLSHMLQWLAPQGTKQRRAADVLRQLMFTCGYQLVKFRNI